jgi:hypothetical protein
MPEEKPVSRAGGDDRILAIHPNCEEELGKLIRQDLPLAAEKIEELAAHCIDEHGSGLKLPMSNRA